MVTIAQTFALALQHHQAGRLAQAEQLCRQILQVDGGNADAWCLLGAACHALGQLAEAESCMRRTVQLTPGHPFARNYLGAVLAQQRKLDEAAFWLEDQLRLQPQDAEAWNNLGLVRAEQWRFEQAAVCYRQAVHLQPNWAAAWANLAAAIYELDDVKESVACYRRAMELQPDSAAAHATLAVGLTELGRLEEAVASCRRALQIDPQFAPAWNNLGDALKQQLRLDEAVASFRQALRVDPGFVAAHISLGEALKAGGQLTEAEACFEQAVRLRPGDVKAHFARAMLWLLRGDLEKGWAEYQWKWADPKCQARQFAQPQWDGSALAGRTILLYADQGLGDTLQFIRYAPLVKERGGTTLVACQADLLRLLEGAPGVDRMVAQGTKLPPFDVQAPLLSLPGIFHTTLATIPAAVPYLQADTALVERWRCELRPFKGLKVGIVWQGRPGNYGDTQRSIPPEKLRPLAQLPGIQLISLQKGPAAEELGTVTRQFNIPELGSRFRDFMDTAAVIKNLDLVISCDTSVLHLAGALGAPTWAALPLVPEWRWLLERQDNPWYPTMRLFRQTRFGQWDDVFERMAVELSKKAAKSG